MRFDLWFPRTLLAFMAAGACVALPHVPCKAANPSVVLSSVGNAPGGDMTFDSIGDLIGATYSGGSNGTGELFEVTGSGSSWILNASFPMSFYDSFSPPENSTGGGPSGLMAWMGGKLYGVDNALGPDGVGSVFDLDPSTGVVTALTSGTPENGQYPYGGVVYDSASSNLWLTAPDGGTADPGGHPAGFSCGVVVETPDGSSVTRYWGFSGYPTWPYNPYENIGAYPSSPMCSDANGNMWGTTIGSGTHYYNNGASSEISCGTLFHVSKSATNWPYQVKTAYLFPATGGVATHGAGPRGPLVCVGGVIYGTAESGGAYNHGLIYAFNGSYHDIVDFTGQTTGSNAGDTPNGLALGPDGDLYGTTTNGGAYGDGEVFRVVPTTSKTTIKYWSFTGSGGNGLNPGGVPVFSSDGTWAYGTAAADAGSNPPYDALVWALDTSAN